MTAASAVLVGDVGGTHARFAIVDPQARPFRIEGRLDLPADAYESFDAALKAYVDHIGKDCRPVSAAIGVAGPVTKGHVDFTNRDWHASEEALHKLGFERALLINDFAATAFSISALAPEDFRTIGPDLAGMAEEPITVVGAGTGFGVSCLARYRHLSVPVATEGGHIGFAPQGDAEIAVYCALERRFGRVSVERVLSGPGLENLHAALREIAGTPGQDMVSLGTGEDLKSGVEGHHILSQTLSAAEIVERAAGGDADCAAALDMFCAIFGAVAGDFALAHGARGGVFITGGIAGKIERFLLRSRFRARFEGKGRLSHYVEAIPTKLIRNDDAAFIGAALASTAF